MRLSSFRSPSLESASAGTGHSKPKNLQSDPHISFPSKDFIDVLLSIVPFRNVEAVILIQKENYFLELHRAC